MSKAETAVNFFEVYNCAQSVLAAHADDYDLEKDKALQVSVGFGAGMGRVQETCGALSGAVMILGLKSGFKEEDRRSKINVVYDQVHRFIDEFTAKEGTIKCRELLGCDLSTAEGQAFFKEHNLRSKCRDYVRFCCELLEKYLEE